MTNKEKIASTVQRMVDQVLEETYDKKIFDEIFCLSQYLIDPDDTIFFEDHLPLFDGFSLTEMNKTHTALKKRLFKEINRKKISFLRTMRIIQALESCVVIGPEPDFSQVTNPKVNFCLKIWYIELDNPFEFIHQLDKM